MGGDELDGLPGVRLNGDSNRSAPHFGQCATMVVDLDRIKVGGKVKDIFRLGDRALSQAGNADTSLIGMLRYAPMPGSLEVIDKVIQRGVVADLLERQNVRSLIVDR